MSKADTAKCNAMHLCRGNVQSWHS